MSVMKVSLPKGNTKVVREIIICKDRKKKFIVYQSAWLFDEDSWGLIKEFMGLGLCDFKKFNTTELYYQQLNLVRDSLRYFINQIPMTYKKKKSMREDWNDAIYSPTATSVFIGGVISYSCNYIITYASIYNQAIEAGVADVIEECLTDRYYAIAESLKEFKKRRINNEEKDFKKSVSLKKKDEGFLKRKYC